MSNTSKSHWPPPEPPDFIPEGWLPLFEAYKLVGRAQFGDEWMDGQELAAASDEDLETEREARAQATRRQEEKALHAAKAKRASVGVGNHTSRRRPHAQAGRVTAPAAYKGPLWPLFNEESRIEARARGDWVWNQLRQWLHADKVSQMVLDNHGAQHIPPRNLWASTNATSILYTGRIEVGGQRGYAFVSISQLEAAIHGEQGGEGKAAVGRPSLQTEIEDACNELITNEDANLDSRKSNYEPIRKIIRRARDLPSDANIRGLGDEAIRKVIAPILDNALTALNEAKTASH